MRHIFVPPRGWHGRFQLVDHEDRFWSKVNIPHGGFGCWEWTGALNTPGNEGYGQLWFNGKAVQAHRFSWELVYGKIPPGLMVLHHCDNRKCCNPAHLFLGDNQANMLDCAIKGRNPKSGLCADDVKRIRKLLADGCKGSDLARLFHVSQTTIWHIKIRHTWSHLDDEGGNARRVYRKEG